MTEANANKPRIVYRFEIPIDERTHAVPAGKIVYVSEYRFRDRNVQSRRVEVWIEIQDDINEYGGARTEHQELRVFGTGQQIPLQAQHVGSTLDGQFVWHVYRVSAS